MENPITALIPTEIKYPELYCVMSVTNLQPMAPLEKDTYDAVYESIIFQGMLNPLIIQHKSTIPSCWDEKVQVFNLQRLAGFPLAPKKEFAIWGGNNRYYFAVKTGVTHIGCYLAPNDAKRSNLVDEHFIYHKHIKRGKE